MGAENPKHSQDLNKRSTPTNLLLPQDVPEGGSYQIFFRQGNYVSDQAQDYSTLDYYIATIPSTLLGSLSNSLGALTPGDLIDNGAISIALQAGVCCDDVTFKYFAKNKLGMVSNVGTVTVKVFTTATPEPLPNSPIYVAGESSIDLTVFTPNPSES
eukprot:Phypoly_transcript_15139.p1 GENE.Phypoly_transcript_15139~~Phypoly_transcript_15139.p1  ORF type:complete len:157 (+),score=17.55 Phypoly_transcript_15139:45-515(+)